MRRFLLPVLLALLVRCAPTARPPTAAIVEVTPAAPRATRPLTPSGPPELVLPPMGAAARLGAEGRVYADRGDYAAALDRFETAYRISPSDDLLYEIGHVFERMGRRRDAAEAYEKMLQGDLSSTDRMSLEMRIQVLRAGGDQ